MDAMPRAMERPRGRWGALLVAALGSAAIAGCTDAQLVNVWSDPDWSARPLRSVLVVSQDRDPVARRLWEDTVRRKLEDQGVDAVASYTLFPDAAPGRAHLSGAMGDHDLDGALTIRRLRGTAETRWVPGWREISPRAYYDPWGGRDVIVYRGHWHPGYRVVDRIAREQLTVWTAEGDARMVWAGTIEIANPGSEEAEARSLAGGMVPGMRRAGLIAGRPGGAA